MDAICSYRQSTFDPGGKLVGAVRPATSAAKQRRRAACDDSAAPSGERKGVVATRARWDGESEMTDHGGKRALVEEAVEQGDAVARASASRRRKAAESRRSAMGCEVVDRSWRRGGGGSWRRGGGRLQRGVGSCGGGRQHG